MTEAKTRIYIARYARNRRKYENYAMKPNETMQVVARH